MDIKKNLKDFYNTEAKKYYYTRNKHRSDEKYILKHIQDYPKKNIKLLEFWCGGGRLIKAINKNIKDKKINYTWVDLSKNLLEFAQKDNPSNKFYTADIKEYIKKQKQEEFDIIIWIASFQHIPNKKERLFILKNFYKSLTYNWVLIMTNRSISKRFILKHKSVILKSFIKNLITLWKHKYNDLQIPRTNKWITHFRYYHMFNKKELNILLKNSWFNILKLTYLDKNGQRTNDRKNSNNTFVIWKKEVFKK